jgi:hypothetical protein
MKRTLGDAQNKIKMRKVEIFIVPHDLLRIQITGVG